MPSSNHAEHEYFRHVHAGQALAAQRTLRPIVAASAVPRFVDEPRSHRARTSAAEKPFSFT